MADATATAVKEIYSTPIYTLDNLCKEIRTGCIKRVVVMTGAGISTSSGIPDFRSPKTGLYTNLADYNVPYPEALFEKLYFRRDPKPFFKFVKGIFPNCDKFKPNRVHYFLRLLQEKNLLHRLYTQNIDGLEYLSGINREKLVEAHGSFRSASCIKCESKYSGLHLKNECLNDKMPRCIQGRCNGVIKPDIVFYGEDLPESFYRLKDRDFQVADCVIVMGTSLEVEPFASLIKKCRTTVPRLLMNRNSVGPFLMKKQVSLSEQARYKDLQVLGDLVKCVEFLVDRIGWKNDFDNLVDTEIKSMQNLSYVQFENKFYDFDKSFVELKRIERKSSKDQNNDKDAKKSIESIKESISLPNVETDLVDKFTNKMSLVDEKSNSSTSNKESNKFQELSKPKSQTNFSFSKRLMTPNSKPFYAKKD